MFHIVTTILQLHSEDLKSRDLIIRFIGFVGQFTILRSPSDFNSPCRRY